MSDKSHSILETVCSYASRNPTRMHIPGHKGRKAVSPDCASVAGSPQWAAGLLDELRAIDVTEAPGLDNLHYPVGCIKDAEARAATLFGAAQTYFLVNGATSGIQASLLAVRMSAGAGSVVLPRNVHRSTVSAMAMSGLEPVFVWPQYEPCLGGYLPLDADRLNETLNGIAARGSAGPAKAVLVINPTYCGFARDLSELADLSHARGMVLVVDEAHGTHFGVGKGLPPAALSSGADLVTHGAHKTTVAFTQTGFLHVGPSSPADFPGLVSAVEEALRAVQSTSPSYILMASIEQAIHVLGNDGGRWVNQGVETAMELAQRLSKIPGLAVAGCHPAAGLPPGLLHDPGRVLVNLGGLGLTGPEAVAYLVQKWRVIPEMTGPEHVLLVVTGADGGPAIEAVEAAFRDLAEHFSISRQGTGSSEPGSRQSSNASSLLREAPRPVRSMSLREAFLSRSRPLATDDARGKVSADTVVIYPPGSAVLTPGERIDRDVVEYILHAKRAGLNVLGRGIRAGEGEMKVFCVESS